MFKNLINIIEDRRARRSVMRECRKKVKALEIHVQKYTGEFYAVIFRAYMGGRMDKDAFITVSKVIFNEAVTKRADLASWLKNKDLDLPKRRFRLIDQMINESQTLMEIDFNRGPSVSSRVIRNFPSGINIH